ncbi:MAG: DUF992 domain-containing protein [Alphaproteobacteria bacterium]|nr:DUF992 domain-containing protein [Alphaproteobacteria bacterium]MDE2494252.1 DUF992 domain-containing protein [Alphaproteobacteria bacterium]
MTRRISQLLGAAAIIALASPAIAAPHGVKVGILTCHVESGWGYVVGSSKDMDCSYSPNHHEVDHYTGSISKFGVDIGYTDSGTIIWDVVAPSSDVRPGALQGDYAGATASATVGAGVGANVLLGGLDKSIALQPVSVMGNTGLDVSAGVGAISLRADDPARVSQAAYVPPQPPPPQPAAVATATPKPVTPHRRHYAHRARNHCTCH